jgi:glycerol-3-phosphate dehydrogenase
MDLDSSLSYTSRTSDLAAIERGRLDLLVIGGGITGAGIARDAALRGLSVALVERRDFASGTSSRSSKLIHGGVRYLAQGDVDLVIEAAEERRILRRIAPHLTQPRPMLVPAYGLGVHTKLNLGLWTYEKIASIPQDERHEMLEPAAAIERAPGMKADGLGGAALYPENLTDDARLVLATLRSAKRGGAAIVNYAEVTALAANGAMTRARIRDVEQGGEIEIEARVVVNAAGPWSDIVRALEAPITGKTVHLTKGIHFVVGREHLPIDVMVIAGAADRRQIFAVPRGDVVYVGTTDTDYGAAADYPTITHDDVTYLIDTLHGVFPDVRLGPEHVVATWAGLRPLIRQPGKKPSEISRKDEVTIGAHGMITVAGGKLTTYRSMAEKVVALVLERLGRSEPSQTADAALEGGDFAGSPVELARRLVERHGEVTPGLADRLVLHHGSEAAALVERAAREGSGLLSAGVLAVEVDHAIESEMAIRLVDVLERRLRLLLFHPGRGLDVAEEVADRMAKHLGWTSSRRDAEVEDYRRVAAACRPV